MKKAKPTAIDLFCGCGGISCGLQQAGFNVLAGVDIEKKYMVTFAQNFTMAKSLCLDISSTSPRNFLKIIGMKEILYLQLAIEGMKDFWLLGKD